MSEQVGSAFWVVVAFILAGILSLCGALCYAEIASLYPEAGGEYIYLREAYGEIPSFLYGWTRFWIGSPGSIAAYAVGSATFLSAVLPASISSGVVAIFLICLFSLINCFSVAFGGIFQTFLTLLKVFMILSLSFAILFIGHGSWDHVTSHGIGTWPGISAIGTAMIGALWAYDGWSNMPMVAGEIKEPTKVIPKALGLGMLLIISIYVLANISYFFALPFSEVLGSYSKFHPQAMPVATLAAGHAFGSLAVGILSVAFVFSAMGAMNGSILTGARVPYAMARDGFIFKRLAYVSESRRVPVISVCVQCVISCALALSGTFDQLTDYVVFAAWIFYALVCGSIFIFRRRGLRSKGLYQTPWYPYFPFAFIVVALWLIGNTLWNSPRASGAGVLFILSGIPFYYWFKWRKKLDA